MSPQCSPNEATVPKIVDESKSTVHPKRTNRQATVRQRAQRGHLTRKSVTYVVELKCYPCEWRAKYYQPPPEAIVG